MRLKTGESAALQLESRRQCSEVTSLAESVPAPVTMATAGDVLYEASCERYPAAARYEIPQIVTTDASYIPEIAAKDASYIPEIVAQDASYPEIVAQDASYIPEIVAEDAPYSEIVAQDVSYPEIVAQDASYPEIVAQDMSYPEIVAQDMSYPEIVAQDVSYPEIVTTDTAYGIPEIVTTDAPYDYPAEIDDSGYGASNDGSYRRDSGCAANSPGLEEGKFEAWEGSDSGVDGGASSGCSTADDCPVVSVNDVVAYYDVRPRRPHRPHHPALSYFDIDKMELAARQSETSSEGGRGEGGGGGEEGCAGERLAVLSYEQVRRLNDVMDEVVSIHGRGNFPTLQVRLRELVAGVRARLEAAPAAGGAGITVRDVRLNGGAASHVLASHPQPYNDIDLIFAVELSTARHADRIKAAVLGQLAALLPPPLSRRRATPCSLKEAYVSKMVRVNSDGDRWSLISLGSARGHRSVELKFVDTMRRQFEFSVDSFQIALDSLLAFHECATLPIGENFYPTVVGESVYGDFGEALEHLHEKLISTRHPEEIRGGGLLKYCALLAKGYRPARPERIKILERYMCSRFFIDFPDLMQQRAKLEAYLRNHFVGREEEALKHRYLTLLHGVVRESTVCLMGHERRQTLALIEALACRELCAERARAAAAAPMLVAHGYYYAPVACYCACAACPACVPPPPAPCVCCADCWPLSPA